MKLVEHFKDFLADTVNINATRLDKLDSSATSIKDFIRASTWKPAVQYFAEQGSWAHKTIIKPVEGNAFDADLVVMVDPVTDWDARTYLNTLNAIFAESDVYKDKVRRFSHCVTIEYAGEAKIDIAPCVVGRTAGSAQEVCNHTTNAFEPSAPESYTTWLADRNSWTGGDGLRKVTRLLKYLRDIKTTFTCPSFLLTTLLGERIVASDASNTTDFVDVPTALKTIVGRLDTWLQLYPSRPHITNPVLPTEVMSDVWTDEQYTNFRNKIHLYREWIDQAYDEKDRDESIGKWRRVFGDDFAKSVAIDKAARVTEAARQFVMNTIVGGISDAAQDLVSLFTRHGPKALPPNFNALPHMNRPPWQWATGGRPLIEIAASLHREKNGPKERDLNSGDGPLPKERWLRFVVKPSALFPIGAGQEIRWRVTNTDEEARKAGCMRGGFEESNDGSFVRWESLSYRGVHMVEAFVLRQSDQRLLAQSAPFYVVVG